MTINGKPASIAQVRKLGWALVNIATQCERLAEQSEQAIRTPTPKEIGEAERARLRLRAAVRHYKALMGEFR